MADWTEINDSRLEVGKPARSIDIMALRDNPIAIAEGAPGAPRIQTAGMQDRAVTDDKLLQPIAGMDYRTLWCADHEVAYTGSVWENVAIFYAIRKGVTTFTAQYKIQNYGTAEVRLFGVGHNQSGLATYMNGATTYNNIATNMDLEPGDMFFIQARNTHGSGTTILRWIRTNSGEQAVAAIPLYMKSSYYAVP